MSSHKRKRTNDAASTLARPFRSPLKATHNAKAEEKTSREQACGQPREKPVQARSNDLSEKLTAPSPSTAQTPQAQAESLNLSPARPACRVREQDHEYTILQKQYSALSVQLTKLNQSVDLAQQALKVQNSNSDAELEALIQKWRSTARDAAEELFSTAKDKVNRMGGVGAWREKQQTLSQNTRGWDLENDIDEDELTDEQKEALEIQREEAQREAEKYCLTEPTKPVEKDNDTFTMDMLLGQLNVELEVIGYDKNLQRWIDD